MKVIDILTTADENKTVQVLNVATGCKVAEYNGKDSIPEDLNGCEVVQLAAINDTIVIYIVRKPDQTPWMDYDTILDFWAYLTDGVVITGGTHGEAVVLQDYSETISYDSKKAAALNALECIKQWAEDDDEAMAFVEDITQGEITRADIRG